MVFEEEKHYDLARYSLTSLQHLEPFKWEIKQNEAEKNRLYRTAGNHSTDLGIKASCRPASANLSLKINIKNKQINKHKNIR